MKINESMTRDLEAASPGQSIREAAIGMSRIDSGALLVNDKDQLVGRITNRDIASRAVAENMAQIEIRHLPVFNREKHLMGVMSLGNIASSRSDHTSGTLLRGVAQAH
jgi:CBS domain-containing protein